MDDKNYNLKMALKQRSQIGKGSYILYLFFWIRGKSVRIIIQKSLQMIKRIFLMAFGCGIVIAALVALLFKSNPQQEICI
jgi:hypothetical protein